MHVSRSCAYLYIHMYIHAQIHLCFVYHDSWPNILCFLSLDDSIVLLVCEVMLWSLMMSSILWEVQCHLFGGTWRFKLWGRWSLNTLFISKVPKSMKPCMLTHLTLFVSQIEVYREFLFNYEKRAKQKIIILSKEFAAFRFAWKIRGIVSK